MTHRYKQAPQDKQAALSGKVENDFNKAGEQKPTQKNEGKRTPESRHDREAQVGSQNQKQARRGISGGAKAGPGTKP